MPDQAEDYVLALLHDELGTDVYHVAADGLCGGDCQVEVLDFVVGGCGVQVDCFRGDRGNFPRHGRIDDLTTITQSLTRR